MGQILKCWCLLNDFRRSAVFLLFLWRIAAHNICWISFFLFYFLEVLCLQKYLHMKLFHIPHERKYSQCSTQIGLLSIKAFVITDENRSNGLLRVFFYPSAIFGKRKQVVVAPEVYDVNNRNIRSCLIASLTAGFLASYCTGFFGGKPFVLNTL